MAAACALVQLGPVVAWSAARRAAPRSRAPAGRQPSSSGAVAGADDDDVLDGLQARQQRGEQRQQRAVDEDDPVGGVVDDPHQLLGGQPEVEGVQHRAHGGDREIRLEVLRVVPHERRHAVVPADPQLVAQRVGELGGPRHRSRAKVRRCGSPSPVQVVTCDVPWTVAPWRRMRVTVSGTSCMVLSTGCLPVVALRGGSGSADCARVPVGMSLPVQIRPRRPESAMRPACDSAVRRRQPRSAGRGRPAPGRRSVTEHVRASSGSSRSLASARDTALLTVPTETPSASAVCASLRSS